MERGVTTACLVLIVGALTRCECGDDDGSPQKDGGVDAQLYDATLDSMSDDGSGDAPNDVIGSADATDVAAGDAFVDGGATDANDSGSINDGSIIDSSDASDGAVSLTCGDGIRGLNEECDDGVISKEPDSCSSTCEIRDLVAWRTPTDASLDERYLGSGHHPVSGGSSNFAVAWVAPAGPHVGMTFYDEKGIPQDILSDVGTSANNLTTSSPVIAELANGQYGVAWTDFGGDGDAEGIAIRLVDPKVSPSGKPTHANATTFLAQYDADILWTGKDVVVSWTDMSNSMTAPDIRYRTFDTSMSPTSGEQTLANSSDAEDSVALAPFAGGWAAAWRAANNGTETVQIKSGGTTWWTNAFTPGPYASTPALAELDNTHLLLVYTEGADWTDAGISNGARVRGAVLDTASPGLVTSFDIAPAILADAGVPLSAYAPNVMRVGTRVYVAWGTEAGLGDPNGEELWLKQIGWNGSVVDLTMSEIPLPRWDAHRKGDQRFAALGASPLGPEGALITGWNDLGKVFSNEANGDVAVELIPIPVLRNSWADGGGM